jgi:hypothetical protein
MPDGSPLVVHDLVARNTQQPGELVPLAQIECILVLLRRQKYFNQQVVRVFPGKDIPLYIPQNSTYMLFIEIFKQ